MRYLYILLILSVVSACWPTSVSFQDNGSMPPEWKTFSVQLVENNSPNTPVSYPARLTESLKDAIQNNSRLILNTETGKGEIFIKGTIANYSITPIAIQEGDNAAKNRLTISVNFDIFISAPKEDLMKVTSTRFLDYSSSTDLAFVESTLLDELNTQINQDVLNKLFSNW